MYLEIVTPEAVLFKGKVTSVTLPSAKGTFQILESHAPIVSLLEKGNIKFKETEVEIFEKSKFEQLAGENILPITSGTIEQNHNRIVILAE
ncbi:MAG: F0F1 ATP synthase subunit epsilon [Capnocytophaga sp.]|nr:F0F1 ATP synthase subunit epsilon [Capnocytophaga sp.]